MDPESFRIAVAQRVGAPVCEEHPCRCGQKMDTLGHHALSCRLSGGRIPRHAALNETLRRAFARSGCPAALEPSGLDRGDGKRPDGMTLFPYSKGRSLVWDATCVDTFAPSRLNDSVISPAAASKNAEEKKKRKYSELEKRFIFKPFAFETTCVFGPSTAVSVQELGRRIQDMTGEPRETLWLKQRLQFDILRGNSFSVVTAGGFHFKE